MREPRYKTIEELHAALEVIDVSEVKMHIDGGEVIVVAPGVTLYEQDSDTALKELFELFLSIEFAGN